MDCATEMIRLQRGFFFYFCCSVSALGFCRNMADAVSSFLCGHILEPKRKCKHSYGGDYRQNWPHLRTPHCGGERKLLLARSSEDSKLHNWFKSHPSIFHPALRVAGALEPFSAILRWRQGTPCKKARHHQFLHNAIKNQERKLHLGHVLLCPQLIKLIIHNNS